MKNRKQLFKYLISLLIFGMNGIVSNQIAMTSEQIVLSRTIIGGALLVILFFATRQQLHKGRSAASGRCCCCQARRWG